MKNYFKGRYYKHQKGNNTICIIVGSSNKKEFLQIITNEEVFQYHSLDGCTLTPTSISLDLPEINGFAEYSSFTPLQSNIMGPFHFLPLQCHHEVISMKHSLMGQFLIRERLLDLNGGIGYIEGDFGHSFPKEYMWLHCNNFTSDLSIMVAIAHVPICFTSFEGCICAIIYNGIEYRLATYKGVTILENHSSYIHLKQRKYDLSIRIKPSTSHPLKAPHLGEMNQIIYESNCSELEVTFSINDLVLFKEHSLGASYERRST